MLQITLFDINVDMCNAWQECFKDIKNISVQNVALKDLKNHDILVTAGNSFGYMRGGIDYYVNQMCNFKVEPLVQESIQSYWGQLPVGKYITVDIDKLTKGKFKALIYAPTMETPKIVPKENVYKTFFPIIDNYKDTDFTLACPGLCALTGGVDRKEVAEQMFLAYQNAIERRQ